MLAASPTPALLSRRNRKEGAIPLFGSDSIRFSPSKAEAEAAQSEEDYLVPLFLRREDLFNAWLASGGAADAPPEVQVTDLRTLVWQMECDSDRSWCLQLDRALTSHRQKRARGSRCYHGSALQRFATACTALSSCGQGV